MIEYRSLRAEEIRRELFQDFVRHQVVTKCWRREKGEWVNPFSLCVNNAFGVWGRISTLYFIRFTSSLSYCINMIFTT